MPPETQRAVVAMLAKQAGGIAALADMAGVSQRTAEGWAQGRPLPIAAAYQIAEALAYLPPK